MARSKVSPQKREAIMGGMEKMMGEFMGSGKMTTSRAVFHPKSKAAAAKQAAAIEYGKHGMGRTGKKRRLKNPKGYHGYKVSA